MASAIGRWLCRHGHHRWVWVTDNFVPLVVVGRQRVLMECKRCGVKWDIDEEVYRVSDWY